MSLKIQFQPGEGKIWLNILGGHEHLGQQIPVNDDQPHSIRHCICRPKFKFAVHEQGGIVGVVVHQSFDLREAFE